MSKRRPSIVKIDGRICQKEGFLRLELMIFSKVVGFTDNEGKNILHSCPLMYLEMGHCMLQNPPRFAT